MQATSITLQGEASKLRQAIIGQKAKTCKVKAQLAEFMCLELNLLTFSDGSMYLHDCELELSDAIPCWWSLS